MKYQKPTPIRCIDCAGTVTAASPYQTQEKLNEEAPHWLLCNLVHCRGRGISVAQIVAWCPNCKINANCKG